MTGTVVGDSGVGFSAISRGNLEPAAEGRMAGTRMAEAPVAVTCHPKGLWPQVTFRFPVSLGDGVTEVGACGPRARG